MSILLVRSFDTIFDRKISPKIGSVLESAAFQKIPDPTAEKESLTFTFGLSFDVIVLKSRFFSVFSVFFFYQRVATKCIRFIAVTRVTGVKSRARNNVSYSLPAPVAGVLFRQNYSQSKGADSPDKTRPRRLSRLHAIDKYYGKRFFAVVGSVSSRTFFSFFLFSVIFRPRTVSSTISYAP